MLLQLLASSEGARKQNVSATDEIARLEVHVRLHLIEQPLCPSDGYSPGWSFRFSSPSTWSVILLQSCIFDCYIHTLNQVVGRPAIGSRHGIAVSFRDSVTRGELETAALRSVRSPAQLDQSFRSGETNCACALID